MGLKGIWDFWHNWESVEWEGIWDFWDNWEFVELEEIWDALGISLDWDLGSGLCWPICIRDE